MLTESYSGGVLSGLSVTHAYDQYLRRTNLTARNGATVLAKTTYGYDAASRLKTVSDGTNTAAYSYLANSPLVGNVWFTNNTTLRMTTTKAYDYLNRLTGISSAAVGSNVAVFNYAYNNANQRTAITNVDSARWVYTYDSLGQVTGGKKYWSDGTPVAGQHFEYGFDDIGNRKNTSAGGDQLGANLRYASYTNNSLNQITGRDVPGYVNSLGTAKTNATVTLWSPQSTSLYATTTRKGEYFRGELPLNNSTGAVWMTITNLAVLNDGSNPDIITNAMGNVFVPKTAEVFQYDRDGNLTNDGRWTYTWDAENRMVRMVANTASGPQQRIDFEFDAKSRRIGKKVWNNTAGTGSPALEQKFIYDGWNLIAVLNSSFAIQRSFIWGMDLSGSAQGAGGVGGLLTVNGGGNGAHLCAHDGNGNLTALVNATNGAVTANYEYGPFGEALRLTGAMAKANPFRFSTKYQDDETDLLYYGYRSYNPSTGRWLSRDPIEEEGGYNLYGFGQNDAVRQIDGLGLAFYAIDGTTVEASEQTNPWWLVQETKERPNRYYPGPKLFPGRDSSIRLALRVHAQIEEDFCAAKKAGEELEINLAGWSRGAMIAAQVAKYLDTLGVWCNECAELKHYRPVKVNWVGLFDAVSMMKDDFFPRSVPPTSPVLIMR